MLFFAVYLTLFMLLIAVSPFDQQKDKTVKYGYVGIVAILCLMAACRPVGLDKDSQTYVYYVELGTERVEPSFHWISSFVTATGAGVRGLFVIYALLSIPLMAYALTRNTSLWYLTLASWMSHYFMVQNLTQIRIAVSVAIFFLLIPYLHAGRKWLFVGGICLASLFHYSALVLLPLVFFKSATLSRRARIILCLIPVIGFVLAASSSALLAAIPIPGIQEKLELYEKIKDNGVVDTESVNLLSVKYLAKLLVYYFVLWKYDILQKRTPYLAFWMKAYACSLLSYAVLSFIPTFAFRISEVLGVVEVAIIPFLIYTVRPQAVGRAFVSVYCLALLLYNVFINELFTLNLS